MNPWETLGLAPGADEREIKRAYARLLKLHRPDADPEGFRRVRDAYEALLRMPGPSRANVVDLAGASGFTFTIDNLDPVQPAASGSEAPSRSPDPSGATVVVDAPAFTPAAGPVWDALVARLAAARADTRLGAARDAAVVAAVAALSDVLASHPGAAHAWSEALRTQLGEEPRLIALALADADLIAAAARGDADLMSMAIEASTERRDWTRLCALARAWHPLMDAGDHGQAAVAGLLATRIAVIDYPLASAIASDLGPAAALAGTALDHALMLGHEVADWPEDCRRQALAIISGGSRSRSDPAAYAKVQILARALLARNPGSAMARLLHACARDFFPRARPNERHVRITVLGILVCVMTFLAISLGINVSIFVSERFHALSWTIVPGCIAVCLGAVYGGRKAYVRSERWFYQSLWPWLDRWLGPIDGAFWWINAWVQVVMMPMLISHDVIPANVWAWLPGVPAGMALSRALHAMLSRRDGTGWRRYLPRWNLLIVDAALRWTSEQATVTNLGWFIPGLATSGSVSVSMICAIGAMPYPDYEWAWAICAPVFLMLWCACHGWFSGWTRNRPLRWTLMWWWVGCALLLAPAAAWAGSRLGVAETKANDGSTVALCMFGMLLVAAVLSVVIARRLERWRYGAPVIPG